MDHGDCLPWRPGTCCTILALGRYIYALGGNEAATRLSGISVNKVKIIVYALCGMLASLAGIIEVARLLLRAADSGDGL